MRPSDLYGTTAGRGASKAQPKANPKTQKSFIHYSWKEWRTDGGFTRGRTDPRVRGKLSNLMARI